jgi:gamma-glutamylcyclotransferase (GGCT)/AIG2-like uncharacterized protein YtfP
MPRVEGELPAGSAERNDHREFDMTDRLFVYGSLAPGRQNKHILAPLEGTWQAATVRGRLKMEGWGATLGFPGLVLDPAGDEVKGQVFTSYKLADFWPELDEFEGEQYGRVPVEATLAGGVAVEAHVYVLSVS